MGTFVKVARVSDVPDGMMIKVEVNGTPVAIARVGDSFFALHDICTHEHCSFADMGIVDGTELICGCHGARFELSSGKVLGPPATVSARTYSVKVEGEDILISE